MTKRCFPDVNVWFALAVGDHPHHSIALDWWESETALIGFSRITQLGFLRLLTTPAVMGGQPLSNRQAWRVYDSLLDDERVRLFPEVPAVVSAFRSFSDSRGPALKKWVDAYLAAYALGLDATLITFDQAFSQYDCVSRILAVP